MTRDPLPARTIRGTDLLLIAAGVLLFYGSRVSALNGDSLLAWPITEQVRHPGTYPGEDLIVSAGVAGHFLLYRLLAAVPFLADNYPLRDFLFYIPVFIAYVAAWFLVFREISGNARLSAVAILLFLLADGKLGLNWSIAPFPALVSYSSIHFAQVFALLYFLRKRYVLSFAILGASSYLHPATALVYFAMFAATLLLRAYHENSLRRSASALIFLVLFTPCALLLAGNPQGAFATTGHFWNIFREFQYHVYLDDHFREGYAYTLSVLALLAALSRSHLTTLAHRQTVFTLVGVGLLGSALWLLNAYTIHNLQIVYTYFVMRAFYVIKPLVILLLTLFCQEAARRAQNRTDTAFPIVLLGTVLAGSPTLCCIVVLSYLLYVMRRFAGLAALVGLILLYIAVAASILGPGALIQLALVGCKSNTLAAFDILLIAAIPVLGYAGWKQGFPPLAAAVSPGFSRSFLPVVVAVALGVGAAKTVRWNLSARPFDFSPATSFGYATTAPGYHALVSWAQTRPGSLFIVPPHDPLFVSFRYLTRCGVYANLCDINQLMYSPASYEKAYRRLMETGFVIRDRHDYAWNPQIANSIETLQRTGADYVIYDKAVIRPGLSGQHPAYENDRYVVMSLRPS